MEQNQKVVTIARKKPKKSWTLVVVQCHRDISMFNVHVLCHRRRNILTKRISAGLKPKKKRK